LNSSEKSIKIVGYFAAGGRRRGARPPSLPQADPETDEHVQPPA
jgi:hypothetical protein